MKSFVLTSAAARDLDGLPSADREGVSNALCEYAVSGRGDVKRLKGRGEYRMRIGRYRVIFAEDQTTILAIYVGLRQTTTYRRR